MLCLVFEIAGCKYVVEIQKVVEVVPRVPLRPLPHMPHYLVGLLDYAGSVLPVVDLGLLLTGEPCQNLLSTRVILANYPLSEGRTSRIGLIAEQVNDIRNVTDNALEHASSSAHGRQAPFLGRILRVDGQLVQKLQIDHLLDTSLRDQLFDVVLESS